jgi:hypothetical protein
LPRERRGRRWKPKGFDYLFIKMILTGWSQALPCHSIFSCFNSNYILGLHARVVVVADDEVVEDVYTEEFACFNELFGELNIIFRRLRVTRGMVANE